MTTEKQTPEQLAAECHEIVRRHVDLVWVKNDMHSLVNQLAALASAQAQQESGDVTRPYGHCSITGPAEDVRFVLRHLPDVDDPPVQQEPDRSNLLTAQEWADLRRFDETARDDNSYAVPAERMKRLACIGVVRRTHGSRYEHTEFGLSLLGAPPVQQARADVDWRGLALDLEARAKTVESQTTERAMLAAAHGLRLMGSAPPAPAVEKRKPLTLDQIIAATDEISLSGGGVFVNVARAIEKAHGITPADAKEGE